MRLRPEGLACGWRIVISPTIPQDSPPCYHSSMRHRDVPTFREEVAEMVSIGFEFPTQSSVVAPNAPRNSTFWLPRHRSKNAKCPIWRRLRTGHAILPSFSCTQSCTQNRIVSNLYRTLHEFNPKSRLRPCRYSEPFNCPNTSRSIRSSWLVSAGDSRPILALV